MPMYTRAARILALVGVLAVTSHSIAQPREGRPGRSSPASDTSRTDTPKPKPDDAKAWDADLSITTHQITLGGETIHYRAVAGCMPLPDYDGKSRANIFFVAYTKINPPAPAPAFTPTLTLGEAPAAPAATAAPAAPPAAPPEPAPIDPATRPITFAFNGGPGSSSVWLHMGALGPKRIPMGPEGLGANPPYALADNEACWLDFTDLVFIDPVSTGYSRPAEGESAGQFHGYDEDLRSVGEFIRLYTTRYQRWASPKFLAGESYGTTRCAGLSGHLQDTHGMYLNGIVLISTVLNFQTIQFNTGNDVPYPLFLPTYTATAFFHKKLAPDLMNDFARTISEVREWAGSEYTLALAKGDALQGAERARIVQRLARYTGLRESYIEDCNLRPRIFNFTKELLRDRDLSVGRLDTRFTGVDADSVGDSPDFDPSMSAITGPYTACLNEYVRSALKYENDRAYEILTSRVQPWSYAGSQNRYLNVAETLRGAITHNPALRVMVAAGYYDLATPFFAADYTFAHLGLPESLRSNIETHYYDAGHMMYIREADLEKLHVDTRAFFAKAIPSKK